MIKNKLIRNMKNENNDVGFDVNSFLNKFSMILATSKNGVIGDDNKLLWNLPNDLKLFKKRTTNKIVIMGRKTYESLPNGLLPNRLNVILCNDDVEFLKKDIDVKHPNTGYVKLSSLTSLFNFIYNYDLNPTMKNIELDEFFVIGGGAIYTEFLPYVSKIYLTVVMENFEGDTKMPNIDDYVWDELSSERYIKNDKNDLEHVIITLKKQNK